MVDGLSSGGSCHPRVDWVPSFWLWRGLAPFVAGIWRVNQLCLSLCVYLPLSFLSLMDKYGRYCRVQPASHGGKEKGLGGREGVTVQDPRGGPRAWPPAESGARAFAGDFPKGR